jgi:hypothetical protein
MKRGASLVSASGASYVAYTKSLKILQEILGSLVFTMEYQRFRIRYAAKEIRGIVLCQGNESE